MDMLNFIDDLDLPDPPQIHMYQRMQHNRINPLQDIHSPITFKRRYHFNKENVIKITEMVRPIFDINDYNQQGIPLNAEQIVCSALELMSGGHFFRVNGDAGGVGYFCFLQIYCISKN